MRSTLCVEMMSSLITGMIDDIGSKNKLTHIDFLGMDAHVSKKGRDYDSDM